MTLFYFLKITVTLWRFGVLFCWYHQNCEHVDQSSLFKLSKINLNNDKLCIKMHSLSLFPDISKMSHMIYIYSGSSEANVYLRQVSPLWYSVQPRIFYLTGSNTDICSIALTLLLKVLFFFISNPHKYRIWFKRDASLSPKVNPFRTEAVII